MHDNFKKIDAAHAASNCVDGVESSGRLSLNRVRDWNNSRSGCNARSLIGGCCETKARAIELITIGAVDPLEILPAADARADLTGIISSGDLPEPGEPGIVVGL